MPSLKPPRHTSTLRIVRLGGAAACWRFGLVHRRKRPREVRPKLAFAIDLAKRLRERNRASGVWQEQPRCKAREGPFERTQALASSSGEIRPTGVASGDREPGG
jgi:hypothetical protein